MISLRMEIRMLDAREKLHTITITINGVRRTASVEPRKLLVHLIRDESRPDWNPYRLRYFTMRRLHP